MARLVGELLVQGLLFLEVCRYAQRVLVSQRPAWSRTVVTARVHTVGVWCVVCGVCVVGCGVWCVVCAE